MKLFTIAIVLSSAVAGAYGKLKKCDKLPKGGTRKYTSPRTIERGDNQPATINFLIDNRATLMSLFARGPRDPAVLESNVSNNLKLLSTFTGAVDDIYMGQIFREARQAFVNIVNDGQKEATKVSEEHGKIYRDNTQRLTKAFRDVTFTRDLLDKIEINTNFMIALRDLASKDTEEGAKVYQQFLDTHGDDFSDFIKSQYDTMIKIRTGIIPSLKKVIMDEKLKSGYRQLINELPLVYQFFNDNIDYVMMANMDKQLDDAVAADIMSVLAKESGDTQIESMINRNLKFIKKLMTQRVQQQMKEKAVAKVMEKNSELKAAAENEAEFNKILAEKKKAGETLTKEQKNAIWDQVIADQKQKQATEKTNQMAQVDNKKKPSKSITRYEHLAGIVNLLPDELLETVAEMVKQSCPDMDLTKIETQEMKECVERQPDNFLDQLLNELHDVCEMFGLIDETKIVKRVVNGVEVEIYAADWMDSKKVEWN